ncbi:DDRGK domain-containing protein 1-like isoform X3 [Periplaneta americana]|uniref:DDRGK domain-containing protein 1-like isoform X3 n=1 Tax=Periplaneta americana TaxID=6978 RepID=UPI0037E7D19A
MAKPNPNSELKQRVKTLEGQVLPLIEEVRILKERMDSRSLHGLEARKEDKEEKELEELRQKYEAERKLRLQLESYVEELAKLRQEREMSRQQDEGKEEELRKLKEELQAKKEHLRMVICFFILMYVFFFLHKIKNHRTYQRKNGKTIIDKITIG